MRETVFSERIESYYDVGAQEANYIRHLSDEYFRKEAAEKTRLLTKEDVIQRRKDIQAKFKKAVGILPDRYAPLNVRICNRHLLDDGITLQNIIYDSLPGLPVTATLWLPEGYEQAGRLPAAIVAVGHSPIGRAHDTYITLARMLARNGIVVLSADPPGQYERVQYPGPDGKSRIGGAVAEHFQMGFPCQLTGLTLASFFVRDLERGLDLLEDLPYVDSKRIAITGCSGGGMMTSYMALWDDRFAAAAASCYITTRQALLRNGRPQDPEQVIPHVVKLGINHDDFMALLAPKPHMICAAEYDGVDIAGAEFTHHRAREVYRLWNAEENARFVTAPTGHGLYNVHSEEITRFLSEVLDAPRKTVEDAQPPLVPQELLRSTETGCLITEPEKTKTIFDCYNEYLDAHQYTPCTRDELRARVLRFLQTPNDLENRPPVRFPRFFMSRTINDIHYRKVWFFSEGESDFSDRRIAVCGVLMEPAGAKKCVILLQDSQECTQHYERFLQEGNAVFLFYPRGIGAIKSLDLPNITGIKSSVGKILSPEYRRNCDAVMCGTSVAALRTYDTLRAYDLIKQYYDDISFAGDTRCALYALLAASVAGTTAECVEPPVSYADFVRNPDYQRDEQLEVFGILKEFDLPFLAALMKTL